MEIRTLGRTGLQVSELCLGTMTFGNQADTRTAHAILDKALDNGVFFIDTADVYPLGGGTQKAGTTESIIGQWLEGKRERVVLATKCFGQMEDGPNAGGLSRKHIMKAVEDSLRRLRTDYIDLYQAHQFDTVTPVEETLRAMDDLVRQGKVRYIGVSNWRAWQLEKALGIAQTEHLTRLQSVQPRYNLLFRMIEDELIPACLDEGVGILSYNPLAGGMLTGRYTPGQEVQAGTRFALSQAGALYQQRYWQEATFAAIERYREWCRKQDLDMATTAVRWVTQQPGITSAIIGASRPEQLSASLAAAQIPRLSEGQLMELNELWFSLPRRREDR
ncbi:MAG: aldo/keto reductase [Firmicutes bacterium]|nr:aldo/keto reductase [Bacillota bacterium]